MGKKTISLTGRKPVVIDEDVWPLIASASDHDGQYEFQANRKWHLFVRQCQTSADDDRCIVYGVFTSSFQNEADRRGGEIVATVDDVPAAVQRVADYLEFRKQHMVDECIADLPAEEL